MHRNLVRFALSAAVLIVGVQAHGQVIVDEDFESYANDAAMHAAWAPSASPLNSFLIDPNFPGDPNNPYGVLPAKGGLDGQAVFYDGVAGGQNTWQTPFAIGPSATQTVEVSVDIGHDLENSNKRHSLGLRNVGAGTTNIIELGFYNDFAPLPSDPNSPNFIPFGYRTVLFNNTTNWQSFQTLSPSIDSVFELSLANDGTPAFHRFGAIIDPNSITFTLDLFADGVISSAAADFNGDDRVDGLDFLILQENFGFTETDPNNGRPDGDANRDFAVDSADLALWEKEYGTIVGVTPGFDAMDVVNAQVILDPNGVAFNNIRFGGPSGITSASPFAAFDNILLEVNGAPVELNAVPEPSTAILALLAGLVVWRGRKSLT